MKKQWIYWINFIFLAVNIGIFIYLLTDGKQVSPSTTNHHAENLSNEFLRQELNFTDEQYTQISTLDKNLQEHYQKVLQRLCDYRYQLLNELAKAEPSKKKLNEIAQNFGFLHRGLKNLTITHLLNIKQVCTPEQLKKLNKIFCEILELDKDCIRCTKKCTIHEKCKRYPKAYYYGENETGKSRISVADTLQ